MNLRLLSKPPITEIETRSCMYYIVWETTVKAKKSNLKRTNVFSLLLGALQGAQIVSLLLGVLQGAKIGPRGALQGDQRDFFSILYGMYARRHAASH